MSSSVHVDNKKKNILILDEGPIQRLDNTILTAEKKYAINFTLNRKSFCLSLYYNEANSYLFINGTEIIKFKAKDSKIVATPLCLGNISKYVFEYNMKKTAFYEYVEDFIAGFDAIVVDDVLDIHKYLMKKNGIV